MEEKISKVNFVQNQVFICPVSFKTFKGLTYFHGIIRLTLNKTYKQEVPVRNPLFHIFYRKMGMSLIHIDFILFPAEPQFARWLFQNGKDG